MLGQIADQRVDFFLVRFGIAGRGRRRFNSFELRVQRFPEKETVLGEGAEIEVVAALHVIDKIIDFHLQL